MTILNSMTFGIVLLTPGEMGLRDIRIVEKICESALKGGIKVPTTTGVLDNKTWLVPHDALPTLPQHFAQHGYARAEFGKIWHEPGNNGEIDPANPPEPRGRFPWYTPTQRAEQRRTQLDFSTVPARARSD